MSGKGYLNNTPDISSGRQANGSQALFRSEAIEAKATSAWLERTPVRTPYLLYVSLFLSVLVLVAFLMILIIGRLDKVVTVHGELVSNPPISYVQAETAGYLLNNKVVRGQKIKAGELMGTLVSESVSINGAKIYETEVAIKKKQMERLKESLVVLGQMLTTAQDNSKNDLGLIEERLENAQENYSSLNKINQSRRKYSVLYKELMTINATTGLEYQSQLERSEAQSQQLRAYKVELKELNTQKTKNNIELKKQSQEVTIKKLEIENELEKLEFDVLQLDKARGENLVSLIDGHVSSIMSNEGVFVASRTPIYGVTPDAAKLVGEIRADVSEAGTVKVGQAVKVKYNAYPYQRYGFFSGIVKSVDLLPGEPNSSSTDKQKFLVMIDVDKDFGTLDDQNVKLKPGLTFDASIVVENRRIYEWFFLPIVKFLHN